MTNNTSNISNDKVCVIGVGYVGEHLVDVFSKRYQVIGYDVSVDRVRAMQSRFSDKSNVTIQNTLDGLNDCDLFCISVPTLLKKDKTGIDTSYVQSAADTVRNVAKPGAVVVMESSVSVGMTRQVLGSFRTEMQLFVGFSPERVDPGRTEPPADKIPKVISGIDDESLEMVNKYYGKVFDTVIKVSSLETAEMCKLYENCFRMINIAYVNEIADSCKNHGIDVYEMINACSTKPYGYMPFYPSLGVGGHCIPVNPFYLFTNNSLPLLAAATDASLNRPKNKANEIMDRADKVLVVGLAFKPGESYTMNSPGLDLANHLHSMNKNVTVYDPLVDPNNLSVRHLNFLKEEDWNSESIKSNFDAVVVAIKQHKINYDVLRDCNMQGSIYKFCDV